MRTIEIFAVLCRAFFACAVRFFMSVIYFGDWLLKNFNIWCCYRNKTPALMRELADPLWTCGPSLSSHSSVIVFFSCSWQLSVNAYCVILMFETFKHCRIHKSCRHFCIQSRWCKHLSLWLWIVLSVSEWCWALLGLYLATSMLMCANWILLWNNAFFLEENVNLGWHLSFFVQ